LMLKKETWLSGIMGLVVGDACGVPVEFKASFRQIEILKHIRYTNIGVLVKLN